MLQVSKKSLWSLILYNFFHDFIHVHSLGQGHTAPRGQSFHVNRNALSLHSFVASLKKRLWSLILCNFFHDLIHVYSPEAGADSPQGTKFWCQQKRLVTSFICCKFQRNHFEVWFYTIFFIIKYMHIGPGQGQTAPRGQNFDVNRKALSLYPFQRNLFEVWF